MTSLTDMQLILDAADRGFVDAWRLMARVLPHGDADEHDGLAIAATGLDVASCNPILAVRAPNDPVSALAHARTFYEQRGLPWMLYASGTAAEALAPAAQAAGMTASETSPGMVLDPSHAQPPRRPAGLEIQVVTDDALLKTFRSTAAAGFETDEDGLAIWANPDLLDTPGLYFYLGLLDGEPAATSCVYGLHGIATVNMVSTRPEYRRRGLGEAMTLHAVEEGFTLGCQAGFLHASEMGFSVYERMGFRHVISYQTWVG